MALNVKATWLCDICKDYRNKGSMRQCGMCGAQRKKSRYAMQLNGSLHLCHIYTLKHTQIMSVMKAMPPGEAVMKVFYPSGADLTLDMVTNMARQALETTTAPFPSDDIGCSPKPLPAATNTREESLFQKVMDEGKKLAYDSKIGRFVPTDTIERRKEKKATRRCSMEAVNTDLNYVKFMAQEKKIMKKVVEEAIVLKSLQEGDKIVIPDFKKCTRRPCALCELQLPEQSLLGEISFKTVARWRAEKNAPLLDSDHRFASNNVYDKALLCLFCSQFFAGDIGGALERGAEEMKAEREAARSFVPSVAAIDTTLVRPASSISRDVEISNLKMRALQTGAGGGIGTSSSMSVLEINSDLHLYRLREDRILKKVYQKRRKEFPGLSLEEFKIKLFESAAQSIGEIDSPRSIGLSTMAKKKTSDSGSPGSQQSGEESKKMTLPEIFLAAVRDKDFRLMADARFLRKDRKSIADDADTSSEKGSSNEGQPKVDSYDPTKDFELSIVSSLGKSKSAKTGSRRQSLYAADGRRNSVVQAVAVASIAALKESKAVVSAMNVKNSWASLLSKVPPSPEAIGGTQAADDDPFSLPKLTVNNQPSRSQHSQLRPQHAPVHMSSSSAKTVTRKVSIAPMIPPQKSMDSDTVPSVSKAKEPSTDDSITAAKAPEWKSTTDASGVFAPVKKLRIREMSLPENQRKPEDEMPKNLRAKTPNIKKKKKTTKSSPSKKKGKSAAMDKRARKEKAREQVEEAVSAYSNSGEDKNATMSAMGYETSPGKKSVASKRKNRPPALQSKHAVSFSGNIAPISEEVVKLRSVVHPRPIQRGGSGLNLLKSLRRSGSQQFAEVKEAEGGREGSPDLLISRDANKGTTAVAKKVNWEETMYNDDFEDADGEQKSDFSSGYSMDEFEGHDTFADEGYEADFEPSSRGASFSGIPSAASDQPSPSPEAAAPSIWGDDLPPRCPSSRRKVRAVEEVAQELDKSMRRTYSQEEFEPIEEPPDGNEYDEYANDFETDSQGYSTQEFELEGEADEENERSFSTSRPSTSRWGSRGEFVNTMSVVGNRAFSPSKCPSSHRRKRRSSGSTLVGGSPGKHAINSPLVSSRPSSSIQAGGRKSPDYMGQGSPLQIMQKTPKFMVGEPKKLYKNKKPVRGTISVDMGSNDPELESAMQEYVDMLFSGEGVDEIPMESKPPSRNAMQPTDQTQARRTSAHSIELEIVKTKEPPPVIVVDVAPPIVNKRKAILPREMIVLDSTLSSAISAEEPKKGDKSFDGSKTTRSGAVLTRIAHEIKGYPSQLDLNIMRRSGEIAPKIDEQVDKEDALLSAVANKLKLITSNTMLRGGPGGGKK